jgi:hypothetical protein
MLILVPPCAPVPGGQPPRTYYQVLGVSPDEQDPGAIEEAALACLGLVPAYQLTCEEESALRLNEIAQVLITLLDPDRRREYDRGLGKTSGPTVSKCRPRRRLDTLVLPRGQGAPPTRRKGPPVLLLGDEGDCDVRLVYRRSAL